MLSGGFLKKTKVDTHFGNKRYVRHLSVAK